MTAVAPYPTRRRAGAPTGLAAGVGLMLGLLLALLLAALPAAGASVAQDGRFDPFQAAGIDPTPGAPVPGDARFLDAAGDTVRLGDLFTGERPVLLAPVYYTCPNVCGATLAGLFGALGTMPLVPGDDLPRGGAEPSTRRKARTRHATPRRGRSSAWARPRASAS